MKYWCYGCEKMCWKCSKLLSNVCFNFKCVTCCVDGKFLKYIVSLDNSSKESKFWEFYDWNVVVWYLWSLSEVFFFLDDWRKSCSERFFACLVRVDRWGWKFRKKKTRSQNEKFGEYKVLNGISGGMTLRSRHGDIMMYFYYYLIIFNNLYMQKKMHDYILISNISI